MFISYEIQADPKPRFFIHTTAEGDSVEASSYLHYFETEIFNLVKTTYPCAELNSLSTVRTLLGHERQRQLLGSGDDNAILNIAQSLGCDYLLSLKVSVLQNTALITATCMDNKKAKIMARAFQSAQHGSAGLDAVVKVSKDLFDGLKEYEICPFTGPVIVNITGTKKDTQREYYNVYCNEGDGRYEKTTTINNYSENEWNIQKNGKNASTGNVKLNLSEEFQITEDNFCYECSPKKQGPRSYFEKTTTYLLLNGLSNESESYGVKVNDARVYLTFLENGTYTIRIKAASTQGEKKTIKEIRAQGICNNINDKPDPIINKVDEGINEIFGPFTGNAQDKVLTQRDTIKRINPVTDEEETITYDFNLTRE